MIHGHRNGASEAGDSVKRALARASGTWGGYQAWRSLDPDTRLMLVEQTLSPATCCADNYPPAL